MLPHRSARRGELHSALTRTSAAPCVQTPPVPARGLADGAWAALEQLVQFYETGDPAGIDSYSQKALARVWKAERFSWWFSSLMHRYPDQSEFDLKMQVAELEFLRSNEAAQKAMAENYVGLPY